MTHRVPFPWRFGLALAGLLAACPTRAATPQDILGIGARTRAMGGAGTALATDHGATYYNPANLAFCGNASFGVEISHLVYDLSLDTPEEHPPPARLRDRTEIALGTCNPLPYGLAFGFAFAMGIEAPLSVETTSLDPQPRFVLAGEQLEQLAILLGGAWRPIPQLSIGAGMGVFVTSQLSVTNVIPVISPELEVANELTLDLSPTAAIHAGIHYRPIPSLALAASWRSALFHRLDAAAFTEVEVSGVLLDVDLRLEAVSWYSPQQFAFGATWDPLAVLTLAADVTWYGWSGYPGPFVVASPLDPDDSVAASLRYPPTEAFGFRDIVVPRVGAEYRLWADRISVRAGFAHRPAIVARPAGRANLLDAPVDIASVGVAYHWGLARHAARSAVEPPTIGGSVAVYGRASSWRRRAVAKDPPQPVLSAYAFGGATYDLGAGFTLSWP